VDEGIKNYRDKSIKYAVRNCKNLDIEHYLISFKNVIGKTMDEITNLCDELGECTYCGVFRRLCLNKKAKELEIDKLVTGHNLDDFTQSILMNFINGDLQKLARLGPHTKIQQGLVPRMLPLRTIPEKETMLYAVINTIAFHNAECPYSSRASRRYFRDIIDTLEYSNPGTRHSILNSYENIKDLLMEKYPPVQLHTCTRCGEPTSSDDLCKACVLQDNVL
jgi:uncharacterized protein (TIGR00269 family)